MTVESGFAVVFLLGFFIGVVFRGFARWIIGVD